MVSKTALRLVAAIHLAVNSAFAQTAPPVVEISIRGKDFYKNGAPWLPKGVTIEELARPASLRANYRTNSKGHFGSAELNAAREVFGADIARFQVSQPGLDPQSPIYDATYLTELVTAIRLARSMGFVTVISMDAQAENGIPNLPCMPNDSTNRAWRSIAPYFRSDPAVIFEPFNEPCNYEHNPKNKIRWAESMQPLIDAIRNLGATNILLLDGLGYGRSVEGLFPLVHDGLPNRLALGVHPYLIRDSYESIDQWRREFGDDATQYPVIAGEWNATPTNGCIGAKTPAVALSLIRYLESLRIGLIVWAIDSNFGPIVKDHIRYEPNDYSSFRDCKDGSNSGAGRLFSAYPND